MHNTFVLSQPVAQQSEACYVEPIEPTTTHWSAFGEPVQDAQVLGDLGLGHRMVADERSNRLFAADEHIQDPAAIGPYQRIEDVRRRG